ncbi:hypothetical protein QTH90_25885 [Variovorax sp. J2P1-59]|uniref:hypothetical protein n=1 Tax=Variovorax flavidus TaxID=3053501 RepID=UPI002577F9EE|nr:hypothetical protein [Variovorax sp. J2P1-59]MDM0077866.1 hypothetical protein [Variovorax sp. J2P1-59]
MPLDLLRQIARQELPYRVYVPAYIDQLRVLQAAGMITAVIPPVEEMPGGGKIHRPAQVLAITDRGEEALRDGQPDDGPLRAAGADQDAGRDSLARRDS